MNKEEQLYQMVIGLVANEENYSKEKIDEMVNGCANAPFMMGITSEEIENVKNRIFANHPVTLLVGSCVQSEEYKYKKWFLNKKSELDMAYWERYRQYLLRDKQFQPNVVNKMDNILDGLTDLLGNPNVDEEFSRKGLIIGDVQSGKTSNYNGLICKAVDAGYNVVIILTGTIENLRKQTQMRMDEGFVGSDAAVSMRKKEFTPIGVSKYNSTKRPWSVTSAESDFRIANAKNLNVDITDVTTPMIFVLKKNVATLRNINAWLTQSIRTGEKDINNSLVLIDDESDNASVNTQNEENNPTTINKAIRELLKKFKKSSYVGFTATPFANIFIDPDLNEKWGDEDLFPKDYIYSLNPPSNYIGARDIFGEEGKHRYMLNEIDMELLEESIPVKHKKDYVLEFLPIDLEESICTFLIANAIRDLRGHINSHRSMLINISRFSDVQQNISEHVDEYLKSIKNAIRIYAQAEKPLKNKYIQQLNRAFNKNYKNIEFKWDEILKILNSSIAGIITKVVNQNNKEALDYENYENGLRVIAIGGLSLSRGLTLEGLIISYFARNSKMYDTLMQMGRWFGYRNKYEDLCRIWMTIEAIEWYEYISSATDELREDIKRYEDSRLTPMDFGIRVRSDMNSLLVTARNKMRSSSEKEVDIALNSKVVETPYIFASKEKNKINKDAVKSALRSLEFKGIVGEHINNKIVYKNIEKDEIINLLSKLEIPVKNYHFDTEFLTKFIEQYKGRELEKWDIGFATGEGKIYKDYVENEEIKSVKRQVELINENQLVKLNKNRLGNTTDGEIGLDKGDKALKDIEREFEKVKESSKRNSKVQDDYFKVNNRNPLFLIYVIEPTPKKYKSGLEANITEIKERQLIGFSIGIPKLDNVETKCVKYKINKIQQRKLEDGIWNMEGEEDE